MRKPSCFNKVMRVIKISLMMVKSLKFQKDISAASWMMIRKVRVVN